MKNNFYSFKLDNSIVREVRKSWADRLEPWFFGAWLLFMTWIIGTSLYTIIFKR